MCQKYLKALLQEHSIAFPKTHNLIELLVLCIPIDASLDLQRASLILLDGYAVRYRYPGDSADKSDAKLALKAASDLRGIVRAHLGLA
jgi:HEPN domain-containing protein